MQHSKIQPDKTIIGATLFEQWRKTRGTAGEQRQQPFGRRWEKLRDAANLQNAEQENDAFRDLHDMESANWLTLKKNRRGHIDRIIIPLETEQRWCAAFGFTPPAPNPDTARYRAHPWEPELAFCADSPPQIPFDEVAAIDAFLKNNGRSRPIVPIKERSLEIFGDEKRLDTLANSTVLFANGRLSLEETLRCRIVPEPLAWLRGARPGGPLLVLENVATFATFRRWDKEIQPTFSALVYGGGNRFPDGVLSLPEIFAETGGEHPIFYFGDLDPRGLSIPRTASEKARKHNLPSIRPLLWAYRELCKKEPRPAPKNNDNTNSANDSNSSDNTPADVDFAWLEDTALMQTARDLFRKNLRIPQESLGWEHMRKHHCP